MTNKFVTTSDFENTNIEKSFQTDEIFKAHKGSRHANHKYLSVDDKGYHYDHSKMTSKDHFDAADLHISERRKSEPASEAHVQHTKLAEEHEALGWTKEGKERKKIKAESEKKLGENVAKKSSSFDEDVKSFLDSQKGKGIAEVHSALAKEFGMNESLTKHYVKKYLSSPEKKEEVKKAMGTGNVPGKETLESGKGKDESYLASAKEKYNDTHNSIAKSEAFAALIPVDFEERIEKADFSTKKREKLADEHEAEPDGSYPIRNEADLHNAIKAYGRSKDKAKTKAWIEKRAKELGHEKSLPEKWEE